MRASILLLIPVLFAAGACGVDRKGSHTAANMKSASETCVRHGYCYDLGRHYARMSAASMTLEWDEPLDLDKARAVWAWGCHMGAGDCCRAMVEFDAVRNEAERVLYSKRAEFYFMPVRAKEVVQAEIAEWRMAAREE